MGMFSFLTGTKPDDTAASEPDLDRAATAAVAPAPADAGHSAPPGSSFQAPSAWNTDALTAPPPEAAVQTIEIGAPDPAVTAALQPKIVEVIKTVFDPEIPVDIYELGLIYEIIADAQKRVLIRMTLTSPACPSAQQIPSEVRWKVKAIPEVTEAYVEIVWEPPWSKDLMSEVAQLQLGFL
jgi:FeS assembly SUF system protein